MAGLVACCAVHAASSDYETARRKLNAIQERRAAPGSYVTFSKREIEAWARVEVPREVGPGFREPHAELGDNVATGRALLDFQKLRRASGAAPNWFVDKFISGERPVAATLEVQSANGRATVYLRRLEISGVAATGRALDFLISAFFMPLYPNAKIGEPFALEDDVESVTIRPAAIYVKIKPQRSSLRKR
jgi:hypothetical protein